MLSTTEDCFQSNDNVNTKTVLYTDDVQPFIYRCALHFEKTRLHKTLSLIHALAHENSTMAKDVLHKGAGSWRTVHRIDKWAHTLKLIIVNDGLHTGVWGHRRYLDACL